MKDIFFPVVERSKMHPSFASMLERSAHDGCKDLMNLIFNDMGDSDGNFIEQFQTTGFDSRTFELGLFATFRDWGLNVRRPNPSPDFIISDGLNEVAIEAVASSPPDGKRFSNQMLNMKKISETEIYEKMANEIPIRMGSPLFTKLQKKYWNLPNCVGKPLVFAIQAFHEPGSLMFADAALTSYLYGIKPIHHHDSDGILHIRYEKIKEHTLGSKKIPSGFFNQPNSEKISGVIFSNHLTVNKFLRLGFQYGHLPPDNVVVRRFGTCVNPDPNATKPMPFEYTLGVDEETYEETWAQGSVLVLNPDAEIPVPKKFFKDMTTLSFQDNSIVASYFGMHPFSSLTEIRVIKKS